MDWVKTVALDELRDKGRALYRHDDKKIALFWVDGRPLAVDNRCPHEGYPLREGTVDAATGSLTCQWHNWKFNLETGRCVYGEDHVRAYRAKSDQGWIWLDLSEPPPETRKRTILEGVAEAVANTAVWPGKSPAWRKTGSTPSMRCGKRWRTPTTGWRTG